MSKQFAIELKLCDMKAQHVYQHLRRKAALSRRINELRKTAYIAGKVLEVDSD